MIAENWDLKRVIATYRWIVIGAIAGLGFVLGV